MKLSRPVDSLVADDPEIERSGDETRLEGVEDSWGKVVVVRRLTYSYTQ